MSRVGQQGRAEWMNSHPGFGLLNETTFAAR